MSLDPARPHLASFARALCCLVGADDPLIIAGHRTNFRSARDLLTNIGFQVRSAVATATARTGFCFTTSADSPTRASDDSSLPVATTDSPASRASVTWTSSRLTGDNVSTALRSSSASYIRTGES